MNIFMVVHSYLVTLSLKFHRHSNFCCGDIFKILMTLCDGNGMVKKYCGGRGKKILPSSASAPAKAKLAGLSWL